jgi:hypothetical protein
MFERHVGLEIDLGGGDSAFTMSSILHWQQEWHR